MAAPLPARLSCQLLIVQIDKTNEQGANYCTKMPEKKNNREQVEWNTFRVRNYDARLRVQLHKIRRNYYVAADSAGRMQVSFSGRLGPAPPPDSTFGADYKDDAHVNTKSASYVYLGGLWNILSFNQPEKKSWNRRACECNPVFM